MSKRNNPWDDDHDDDLDDEMESEERGPGGGRGDRSRGSRRKEDFFRTSKTIPNYKDVDTLRRFMTERAKIRPRRQTGLSSKNQRLLARQIKRARQLALLPFTDEQNRG